MTEILYFIEAADGPIKIGVSGNPYARLSCIQVDNAGSWRQWECNRPCPSPLAVCRMIEIGRA